MVYSSTQTSDRGTKKGHSVLTDVYTKNFQPHGQNGRDFHHCHLNVCRSAYLNIWACFISCSAFVFFFAASHFLGLWTVTDSQSETLVYLFRGFLNQPFVCYLHIATSEILSENSYRVGKSSTDREREGWVLCDGGSIRIKNIGTRSTVFPQPIVTFFFLFFALPMFGQLPAQGQPDF